MAVTRRNLILILILLFFREKYLGKITAFIKNILLFYIVRNAFRLSVS